MWIDIIFFESCFKFKSTLFKSLSKELQAFKMVLLTKWLRKCNINVLVTNLWTKMRQQHFRLFLIILDILTYWNALEKTNKSGYFHCHTLSYWIYCRLSYPLSLSLLSLSLLILTQRINQFVLLRMYIHASADRM